MSELRYGLVLGCVGSSSAPSKEVMGWLDGSASSDAQSTKRTFFIFEEIFAGMEGWRDCYSGNDDKEFFLFLLS